MTADKPSHLVPKLRFPEFRDEPRWDLLTLSSASDVNPSNDGLPEFFIYIDLESVKSSMLIERKEITRDVAPSRAQRLLSRKDIIYQTVRPYQRNNFFFDICDGCKYVASTGYAQLRAYQCSEFLYQILHTDSFVNSVLARCTGSNYPAINPSNLASIHVALPRKPEQQKIADCLGSLDDLIAAEGWKLETLRQHKQGLMQQLFPQPGETVPRLRFLEFRDSGRWEAEALGSVCKLYQPETLAASELKQGGPYLVYGANGVIGKHDRYNHEDSEIVVTCRGATCGEVNRTQPKSWITGNAMVVKSRDERIGADFIFHSLKSSGLTSIISGSAQPQITRAGFSPFLFVFPESKDEQQKIADCLGSLDDLIAAKGRKLEALRQHKHGLLQQLFPSLDGQ